MVVWMLKVCAVDAQHTCVQCSAGTYKSLDANSVCDSCGPNKFSAAVGATAITTCSSCWGDSSSPSGSSTSLACLCNAGFTTSSVSSCAPCVVGKYKVSGGNAVCTDCLPNSGTNTTGSTQQTACECKAGFTGVPGGCTPSAAGTYKPALGSAAGSNCTQGSWSAAGSTALLDCKCNAGYIGNDGGQCTQSPAGSYKSGTGTAVAVQCGANSWSPAGSTLATHCKCVAGHSLLASACTACGFGRFKEGTNDGLCQNCPFNTFSTVSVATSQLNCTACRSFSTTNTFEGQDSQDDCKCDAGYYTLNMNTPTATCLKCVTGKFATQGVAACSDCGAGKYASAGSTFAGACLTCVAGKYSMVNQSQCETCPSNSNSPASSGVIQNCTCNAGAWPANNIGANGVACTLCLAGTFKAAPGPQSCTLFTNNVFSSAVGSTSVGTGVGCPVNSACPDGSDAVTDCLWKPGYSGVPPDAITNTTAVGAACAAGKFRTSAALPGDGCTNCAANFWSNVTAKTDSTCFSCGLYSISPAGSAASAACLCSAGFGLKFP